MQKHRTVDVPATTKQVVTAVLCDRCDKDITEYDRRSYYVRNADFGYRMFKPRDFECEFSEGPVYPEGGSVEGWEVEDLCDECVEVLRGLLVANGFKLKAVDKDY